MKVGSMFVVFNPECLDLGAVKRHYLLMASLISVLLSKFSLILEELSLKTGLPCLQDSS